MALADAQNAITDICSKDANGKAYHRAGMAAYNLGQFIAAQKYFEQASELQPDDTTTAECLTDTYDRVIEGSTGKFNFEAITKEVIQKNDPLLDLASFISNTSIRKARGRGRGLFAVKDIKAGELVMCEQALCTAFGEEQGTNNIGFMFNLEHGTATMGTHTVRLTRVIHKLLHRPKLTERFNELYNGDYKPKPTATPTEAGGLVPVDTFAVQAALELNGFSIPSLASADLEDQDERRSTGVWLHASAINHDCIGNASRSFIGEMILIRATKNIAKNEEITMRYMNPNGTISDFQETLQKTWKFKCSCALCKAEMQVSTRLQERRMAAIEEAGQFLEPHVLSHGNHSTAAVIGRVEALYHKIEATYSDSLFKNLPRPALGAIGAWLATAYALQKAEKPAIDWSLQVLRDLGVFVKVKKDRIRFDRTNCRLDMTGINAAMYAASAYKRMDRKELAEQMIDFGKELYRTLCGSMYGFEKAFEGQ